MASDPFAPLWPSSYKGAAFWAEKDDEEGGRRLVVNKIPYRDAPVIEDLGCEPGQYRFTAYLTDDTYESDVAALRSACNSPGAGTLVLPLGGPVNARCKKFRRSREQNRTGYVAFDMDFVRDDAATASVSADYLAQLAFDAVSDAAGTAVDLAGQMTIVGAPSWVAAAALDGLQTLVATLDALRTGTGNVDPVQSQALAGQLTTLYNALPAAVSPVAGLDTTIVPTLVALAQTLGAAMPPVTAADAFGVAADALAQPAAPDPTQTINAQTAATNAGIIARVGRYALLAAYLAAIVGATYASRPEGINAKVLLVYRFDRELELCAGAPDERLYDALQTLRNTGVAYLEALITTLAPVLTISTGVALPSLVAAWMIYQDPTRALDLVRRNDVKHPSFMPLTFEALAPPRAAAAR